MLSTLQQCNAYLNAYADHLPDLLNLKSYLPPGEHATDADLLMTIGQLITDIDDLHNTQQPITPGQDAFYTKCTGFFANPIIKAIINLN